MKLRELLPDDIDGCVDVLIATHNAPPWNDHWTEEAGNRNLSEFMSSSRFIGYAIPESDQLVGALSAHRRTSWTNDETYVDELFIRPDRQRRGHGKLLMKQVERMSQESGLGGVALLTRRDHPAKLFSEKNGYAIAEHVVFMHKEAR